MTKNIRCGECGEGDARSMTIQLGDEALFVVAHASCATAIKQRHAEWLSSPEGRIAMAERAGLSPCNACGTTKDVQAWNVLDASGSHPARACLRCACDAERAHPGTVITAARSDEQRAELARWNDEGIGSN